MLSNDLRYAWKPSLWARACLDFNADPIQTRVLDSDYKRLILNCHRQFGKSICSALLCLHRALYYPKSLCLIIAPALRQSSENFRKVLDFLDRLDEPPQMIEDTKLSLTLENSSRILSLPGANEGRTIRGFSSPSIIVEDESARCSDELYTASLRPMLASNSNGRLILCSTPYGKRGHFYKTWIEGGSEWLKIQVVASNNPRISSEFLQEERRTLDGWTFQQEYEGVFVQAEDAYFSNETIQRMFSSDPSIEVWHSGVFDALNRDRS
jgi:hypothetical protein